MSEQPKEYCEHWVVCKHAHALLYCPVDATGKHHKECEYDTRSRPHPEPERDFVNTPEKPWCYPGCMLVSNAKTEASRKAREEALALLGEWDYHNNHNFGKPHPLFADMIRLVREKPDEIRKHLESLRSKGGP